MAGMALLEENRQWQKDELELMEAMQMNKEGFTWEEKQGAFQCEIRASVELDQPVAVKLSKRIASTAHVGKQPHSVLVEHLPPLSLHFVLPADYPSSSPPSFTLYSCWLNFSQLTIICRELDQIWLDSQESVVLYLWQQFLAHDALTSLGVE